MTLVCNFYFILELPYKVKIEYPTLKEKYHEDITTVEKKNVLISEQQQVYANIELKKTFSVSLKRVELDDLVETLLYGLYYLQEGRAIDHIYSVLTDFSVWLFRHNKCEHNLELVHYNHFIDTGMYDTMKYVCSFLNNIK